ncbi:hypothetical protein MSAN_00341000 [Mycena sanguinolenta]|uniref:Uncharacterized protein n=1 Tax=Mycena sanguinolenta TaxID=230812 RepID=A0A8H6ZBP2_9AGAR|nr:hypothetical protein MSAN_00341000 [Mycena sanguinolenta]
MTLDETTSRAEALCAQCATTPGMNAFQPIAASAVEVCCTVADLVANGNHNHSARMEKLAAFVVNEAERAVNGMTTALLSPETLQDLTRIEAKLDEMRRVIEHTSPRSKKGKLFKHHTFGREMCRLERELKSLVNALLKDAHKLTAVESSGISPAELANLTIRTASAICEAPVLNFLKPVVGVAETISETAQTVKSNRKAALQLAAHSKLVTRSIAEHAATIGSAAASNDEALASLNSVLSEIRSYLGYLQKPPRRRDRVVSWIMANKEKDRIQELNRGLDKALALFAVHLNLCPVLSLRTQLIWY